jgi:hypothetical protein
MSRTSTLIGFPGRVRHTSTSFLFMSASLQWFYTILVCAISPS